MPGEREQGTIRILEEPVEYPGNEATLSIHAMVEFPPESGKDSPRFHAFVRTRRDVEIGESEPGKPPPRGTQVDGVVGPMGVFEKSIPASATDQERKIQRAQQRAASLVRKALDAPDVSETA